MKKIKRVIYACIFIIMAMALILCNIHPKQVEVDTGIRVDSLQVSIDSLTIK